MFAAISGLSYGASDFSGGLATKRADTVAVTLLIQAVSLCALAVVLVVGPAGQPTVVDLVWGGIAGLGVSIGLTTFYKALAEGPMSTAASVTAMVGSIIPVLFGLALGEVPNALTSAGVALAVPAGIAVSLGGIDRLLAADLTPRARARRRHRTAATRRLSVVAGVGFGCFFVALAQTSADAGLHPLLGARGASIVALAVVVIVSPKRGLRSLRIGRSDWPAVGIGGVLDCSANSFYLLALGDGSVTWVAAIVSLYPAATVLLAWLFLRERLAAVQFAGLAVAACSLVLVSLGAT